MNALRIATPIGILLLIWGAISCFGPWYTSPVTLKTNSVIKLVCLIIAAAFGFVAHRAYGKTDLQRRSWLIWSLGLTMYALGQSVLAYYQILRNVPIVYPSAADFFFFAFYLFCLPAAVMFCVRAFRSGLPLGRGWKFWWPAVVVLAAFLLSVSSTLVPMFEASTPWLETFFNATYTIGGFSLLAPCVVMIRVGLKFRGGSVLKVWLPISLGFTCVLLSDILFFYLTQYKLGWAERCVDFLYIAGYIAVARGSLFQLQVMK